MRTVVKRVNPRALPSQKFIHVAVQFFDIFFCVIAPGYSGLVGDHHQFVALVLESL